MKATVFLDVRRHVGPVDRRIFGGFLEHIGRAVYEGIYDPAIVEITEASVLSGDEPNASNTWERPEAVWPISGAARIGDSTRILVDAPALSLTVVEFSVRSRSED